MQDARDERFWVGYDPLPIEERENGLYIHQAWENNPDGTKITTITVNGETTYHVSAQEFMAMQKERDTYRRIIALINAWRMRTRISERNEGELSKLLMAAGFGFEQGRVMNEIIEQMGPGPGKDG